VNLENTYAQSSITTPFPRGNNNAFTHSHAQSTQRRPTCNASSRVGSTTRPLKGPSFLVACMRTKRGTRNAKVFPVPVGAATIACLPVHSSAKAAACTGVGATISRARRFSTMDLGTGIPPHSSVSGSKDTCVCV
jgi:hypothetical protein